jgi:hypothetical protein
VFCKEGFYYNSAAIESEVYARIEFLQNITQPLIFTIEHMAICGWMSSIA